jgi:hypothetical protein
MEWLAAGKKRGRWWCRTGGRQGWPVEGESKNSGCKSQQSQSTINKKIKKNKIKIKHNLNKN